MSLKKKKKERIFSLLFSHLYVYKKRTLVFTRYSREGVASSEHAQLHWSGTLGLLRLLRVPRPVNSLHYVIVAPGMLCQGHHQCANSYTHKVGWVVCEVLASACEKDEEGQCWCCSCYCKEYPEAIQAQATILIIIWLWTRTVVCANKIILKLSQLTVLSQFNNSFREVCHQSWAFWEGLKACQRRKKNSVPCSINPIQRKKWPRIEFNTTGNMLCATQTLIGFISNVGSIDQNRIGQLKGINWSEV